MARPVIVLAEALVMLERVGASKTLQAQFKEIAEKVIGVRPEREVDEVSVSSSYGATSHRGAVELTVNDTRTQMEPKKAKEIGLMLLEAAEAAQSDEIMVKFLVERVGLPQDAGGRVLLELREMRQGTKDVSRPH